MKLPVLKAPLSQEIQIGCGKCLIEWCESGIKGKCPLMPGEGFSTWNYTAIAQHFYQKYQLYHHDQSEMFHQIVLELLNIVEKEHQTGNLYRIGVWSWCTLPSGKQWPLSKWIKINTSSPYKRAYQRLRTILYGFLESTWRDIGLSKLNA